MFQRAHHQLLVTRLKEPRRFMQVVLGPRQVGKTTLVEQVLRSIDLPHLSVSADGIGAGSPAWLEQQWEAARLMKSASAAPAFLLVIDEIQKVSNWSETVKRNWDADTRAGIEIRVVLLGSSRILIQDGLTESLAGRFETIYMGHWNFSEMQSAFDVDLDRYVWFGGYPGAASLMHDESRWKAYVRDALIETSITKDILMMTRVDKPVLMRRLFELGCLYSAQILSFNKMLGQLQDARNTVTLSHYLHLLDMAGLLCGIEKYAAQLIRQRSSSPKFQVHNTAIIAAQRHEMFSIARTNGNLWGRCVESAVGAHLINDALAGGYRVSYWRERHAEVDFVMERAGEVIGIEVKSNHETETSGMDEFRNRFQPKRVLLVGAAGLPLEAFLKLRPADLF